MSGKAGYGRIKLILCLHLLLIFTGTFLTGKEAAAQTTSDKMIGKKNEAIGDSIKNSTYPYLFPIWGQKVVAKGFKMQKSAGFSAQYLYQQSDIIINNLQVGFNGGTMHNLDEIIRFNSAVATTNGVNVRPDLWVFPFLNVYGILAKSKSSTAIDAGVYLPGEDGNWSQITSFKTKAEFDATTYGFGITPSFAIAGYFMTLDANFSWSDIPALAEPAFVFVLGPRIGKNFVINKAYPDRSLAVWIGGFRVQMASKTVGTLNASELFPIDEWGTRIDEGYQKAAEGQQKVDTWWAGLTPQEQRNPVNVAKHEAANKALGVYGAFLDKAGQVVSGAGDASINYSLEKTPKDKWNFLIGSQFQLNRSWMLRAEYGFLSSRQQLILGLQYRFDF